MTGGKAAREKMGRSEREIVNLHKALGIKAERVPLSGATGYLGRHTDVDVYPFGADRPPLVCELKARADGKGFVLLKRWLSDADVLFLREDRQKPIVVLPWKTWEKMLKVLWKC